MPTLLLGNKLRQFKQLTVLQRRRLARKDDPLSVYQHEHHGIALRYVSDILRQEWMVLLIERRFLLSRRSFTEHLSKYEVTDKLLAALESYEDCLSHQAAKPESVAYDLTEFERRLSVAIQTVHSMGGGPMLLEAVERPKAGWKCVREYETWKGNWRVLSDPEKGKLRVQEWDVPELGQLLDGQMTVTFFGEDGDATREVPLAQTLPDDLKDSDEDRKKSEEEVLHADASAQHAIKQVASPKVPQDRTELAFRARGRNQEAIIKFDQGNGADFTAVEKRPSIRLVLLRQQPVKREED